MNNHQPGEAFPLDREVSTSTDQIRPGQWSATAMHGPKHQGRFWKGVTKVLLWWKCKPIPKTNANLKQWCEMVYSCLLYTSIYMFYNFKMMRSQFTVEKVLLMLGQVGSSRCFGRTFCHWSIPFGIQQVQYHCNCMFTLNIIFMWIIVAKFWYINLIVFDWQHETSILGDWRSFESAHMQRRLTKSMT